MLEKGKKSHISKVKRGNQKRTKLTKQGKLKNRRHKHAHNKIGDVQSSVSKKAADPEKHNNEQQENEEEEEESDHGEDMLGMVEEDDLKFLKNAVSSHSYSIFNRVQYRNNAEDKHIPRKRKRVSNDEDNSDLEEKYEQDLPEPSSKVTKQLLPIKTKEGIVRRTAEEDIEIKEEPKEKSVEEQENGDGSESEADSDLEVVYNEDKSDKLDLSQPLTTADLFVRRRELLQQRKLSIGVLCSGILENPENKLGNFKHLFTMLDERTPEISISVKKLAAASLVEVFRDILPSYQIKHQETESVKLKKVTLQLQHFEKDLLRVYKTFLQKLEKMASVLQRKRGDTRVISSAELKLGQFAVRCMCELLTSHPYFNFAKNLSQVLVPFLNNRSPDVRRQCVFYFQKLFKEDRKEELSLDVVRHIDRLVKSRSHEVHCEVLEVLLALRIQNVNLDKEKEDELKQKKFMTHREKLLKLSKRERKRSKKLEQLEKELLETKAEENKQTKQTYLTEITKVVFTIYFRVLKAAPSSKLLRATLEGLAKYAHCINLDFYHDLVNVLNRIVEQDSIGCRERLHCVRTVFAILSGQGDVLNIDPSRFYTHLYKNMLYVNAGRTYQDCNIVLKTLEDVLVQRRKKISRQRLLAFVKRTSVLSTQLLHNGSLGCLSLLKVIFQLCKSAEVLLDLDTSVGQGIYFPELEDPEYCNADGSALWELLVMLQHYHPTVRQMARHILYGAPSTGEGILPTEIAKLSAEQMFSEYNPSEMAFKPSVPPPRQVAPKSKSKDKGAMLKNCGLNDYVNKVIDKINFRVNNVFDDCNNKIGNN